MTFRSRSLLFLVMKAFPRISVSIDQLVDVLALIWNVEAVDSDPPDRQNDPYVELKKEPSFFKINLPRGITKKIQKELTCVSLLIINPE